MNKYKSVLLHFLIINLFIFNNVFVVRANTGESLYVNAKSAIAIDAKNKQVFYQKNSEQIIPMASTTKIMTCLVALKYGQLDKKITISKRAANVNGSQVGYKQNEQITLRELLYGLMMRSGNDAAIAIAEGVGGSVKNFVEIMNHYAYSIGAFNTHFESPHGLDSQNHYCTAYDLAIITVKAKECDDFNKIVSSKSINNKKYNFTRSYNNINKILWQIPNSNGVKTGYTGNAGKCLVTSVKTEGNDLIIVILNSNTRWKETQKIYKYVKNNYKYKIIFEKGQQLGKIKYNEYNTINLICDQNIILPIKNNTKYYTKIETSSVVKDSISKGDIIGYMRVYDCDNNNIFNKTLISNKDVKKLKFTDKIKNKIKSIKLK